MRSLFHHPLQARSEKIVVKIILLASLLLLAMNASGQFPGVPVESTNVRQGTDLTNAAHLLLQTNGGLAVATIRGQLHRTSCNLELTPPAKQKLTSNEVWQRARTSYLRVGWYFLCTHCDSWHLNLAGGYVLTADGAVGTAYHVAEPPRNLREGRLIVANDAGKVFPVTEILAGNRYSDVCILRVKGDHFTPLPLSTNVSTGDRVFCLSDPAGRRGYFSQGIVKRFFSLPERRSPYAPGAPSFAPTRISVTTDWSFGSSGAPLLDECGNVIGHVSTISVEESDAPAQTVPESSAAKVISHEAVSALDVLALVKSRTLAATPRLTIRGVPAN